MTAARRRYSRWYICILLLCFCHHKICAIDASDAQPKQRTNSLAEDDLKPRKLIMRGQNSQPADRAMNKDKMTAKQIAKVNRVDRKRMQMMARRKKKESIERNKMRTNRGRIKPQYDWQPNANLTPKKGQPSDMDKDRYGPPPVNADGPPPPMRPPPPMWEGTGYRPPPPPPLDRPPPPPHDDMMEPSSASGSKASKVDGNGSGNKPPIMPGKPPQRPFPPSGKPYPPHYPPGRPLWSPTYMPTKEPEVEGEGVQITVEGLLNTYGLGFPLSSEGYDAMVTVFDLTIHESSSTSLDDNQMVIQVKILEIEGITSQFLGGSHRELQYFDSNSFQCTIVEQKQCCEREPPPGSENPAQFCESMGCNINDCRRIRFDIIAEQFSRSSKLQPQSEVDELSTAITESITQQINSGAFTFQLRENGGQCGDSCSQAFSTVAATSAVFAPPTDINIIIRTATPTPRPTRKVREKVKDSQKRGFGMSDSHSYGRGGGGGYNDGYNKWGSGGHYDTRGHDRGHRYGDRRGGGHYGGGGGGYHRNDRGHGGGRND